MNGPLVYFTHEPEVRVENKTTIALHVLHKTCPFVLSYLHLLHLGKKPLETLSVLHSLLHQISENEKCRLFRGGRIQQTSHIKFWIPIFLKKIISARSGGRQSFFIFTQFSVKVRPIITLRPSSGKSWICH